LAKADEIVEYLRSNEPRDIAPKTCLDLFFLPGWVQHRRLLQAYLHLIRGDLAPEAEIIGRSIVELAIDACWIGKDETRAKAWLDFSQWNMCVWLEANARLKTEMGTYTPEEAKHVEAYKAASPQTKPRFPVLKDRAKSARVPSDEDTSTLPSLLYELTYARQCDFAHGRSQSRALLLTGLHSAAQAAIYVVMASAVVLDVQGLVLDRPDVTAYAKGLIGSV
jgi:hypothetical protein